MDRPTTSRLLMAAFHLLIFCLGLLSMGFQIVASRELAPVFGSSIIVWAFLISTFLIAFSLGSFLGGGLCRGHDTAPLKRWLIVAGLALLGFCINAFLRNPILSFIEDRIESLYFGLTVACLLLFLLPVIMVSSLSPLCVQFYSSRMEREQAGQASGAIYGVSTLGNIAGVMLTTLLLVPHLTVTTILHLWTFSAALVLAFLCLLVYSARR